MRLVGVFLLALLAAAGPARAQMPDLGSMSGTPLPAGEMPNGTVSVRVVRGDLTNNVVGQDVELHGAPQPQTVKTDDSGRAVFNNVPAGATVHVMTRLDGRTIESQNFAMPPTGGVRLILVGGTAASGQPAASASGGAGAGGAAGAPAAQAGPATPATPGRVTLGGQSRFVLEVGDEGLDVYNLFDIVNASGGPVTTEPLVFEVPDGAQQLTVLEGSSPQAKADGSRFVVTGPFATGITSVQLAYRLTPGTGSVDFEQVLPVDLAMTQVIMPKVGNVTLRSPQAASSRESQSDGRAFVMATGQGLPAGGRIQFELDGLPHHARWPRFVALGIAVFLIGIGVWLAANGPDARVLQARQKLEQKRASLLDDLVSLEKQRAAKAIDEAKFATRREPLMSQLERVYAQLDHDGGSGQSPAAAAGSTRTVPAHAGSRT